MSEDGEEWIRVRVGTTKSSTIRNIYSSVDEWYSQRPNGSIQEQGDKIDEDSDVRPDSSIGTSSDASEADSELGSETDHTGEGNTPIVGVGSETDGRTAGQADNVEESTDGSDEQSPPIERTEPQSDERSRKYGSAGFHFAPHQHLRGDTFN